MTKARVTDHHELDISGMSCASCVTHVEEALQAVDGVQRTSVDLGSGRATVDGASIDPNQLVEAVSRAGYGVRPAI